MKLKPSAKKSQDKPQAITELIDRAVTTPFVDLVGVLQPFTWEFDKGDLYHWVGLLNYFDDFFETYVKPRGDLHLRCEETEEDKPFPTAVCLEILRVTRIILDACSNKHLYSSVEHLTSLLAAADAGVLMAALETLEVFVRKSLQTSRSTRWHGEASLNARLFALSQGWGGKEEGLGLVACAMEREEHEELEGINIGTTLHFEFYSEGAEADAAAASEQHAGLRVIHIPNLHKYPEGEHDICKMLVQRYSVPEQFRFSLLTRIRVAKSFCTLEGRRFCVSSRLLAFMTLLQSSPDHEDLVAFFSNEPEFVMELVGLLKAEGTVPEAVRTQALRALATQTMDRSRQASVVNTITSGGHSGVLAAITQGVVNSLTGRGEGGAPPPPPCSLAFAEALLALVFALASSHSGCSALSEAGLIPSLLPLLADMAKEHVFLVTAAVRIMEAFMDFSNSASTLFRDLGGLSDMVARLRAEVGVKAVEKSDDPAGAAGAGTSTGAGAMEEGEDAAPPPPPKPVLELVASGPVPYSRRLLLKALLRAISLAANFATTAAGGRMVGLEDGDLARCLGGIFMRAADFGGGVFSLAATVMADLIHHDPTCFAQLDAAGLPQALLDAVAKGVLPSSEAVCSVPNALIALCLNTAGLRKVRHSGALRCFVPMFTTRAFSRALQGDTPSVLGAGIDELLRHVPALRSEGIKTIMLVLKELCRMGGDAEGEAIAKDKISALAPTPRAGGAAAGAAGGAAAEGGEAMDTEEGGGGADEAAAGASGEAPETTAAPTEVVADVEAFLPDAISNVARLLEAMLANTERFSQEFIENGGLELLLRLYTLPKLPESFGSSPASHSLSITLRAFAPQQAPALAAQVGGVLRMQLQRLRTFVLSVDVPNVLDLAQDRMEEYSRRLSGAVCLVMLTSGLARSIPTVLSELSKDNAEELLWLGDCHRTATWHLGIAEEAKAKKDEEELEAEASMAEAEIASAVEATEAMDTGAGGAGAEGGAGAAGGDAAAAGGGAGAPAPIAPAAERTAAEKAAAAKKQTPDDVLLDALAHFGSAVKSFQLAITKALVAPTRRREGSTAALTLQAKTAAMALAGSIVENLRYNPPSLPPAAIATREVLRAKYLGRVVDELAAVLFDLRRRTCHTLVLNYLMRTGGMEALLAALSEVAEMLWALPPPPEASATAPPAGKGKAPAEAAGGEGGGAAASGGGGGEGAGGKDGGADDAMMGDEPPPLGPAETPEEIHRAELHDTLRCFVTLLENLVNANLLLASPATASMLVMPRPEQPAPTAAEAGPEAEALVKRVQSQVLGAVLPLWNNEGLAHCPVQVTMAVLAILVLVAEGTSSAAEGERRARGGAGPAAAPPRARAHRQPDPVVVQHLVEMGFPQARVEEALRHVGSHSMHLAVEMAMEWLFSNPEPDPPPPAPAAAAEAEGGDAAGEADAAAAPEAAAAVEGGAAAGGGEAAAPAAEAAAATSEGAAIGEDELARAIAMSMGQPFPEPEAPAPAPAAAAPAAPKPAPAPPPAPKEEPPPPTVPEEEEAPVSVDLPSMQELIPASLALLSNVDAAPFALADLMACLCSRNKGAQRGEVFQLLVDTMKGLLPEVREGGGGGSCKAGQKLSTIAHTVALVVTDDMAVREAAVKAGIVPVALDLLDAVKGPGGSSGGGGEGEEAEWLMPKWGDTLLLILDALAVWKPKPPEKPKEAAAKEGEADAAGASDAAAAGAAGTSGGGGDEAKAEGGGAAAAAGGDAMGGLAQLIQVSGFLSGAEQERAMAVCLRVLRWASASTPPSAKDGEAAPKERPAASTAQASLQLMARLSKKHGLALQLVQGGGMAMVTDLPPHCHYPAYEAVATAILRHVIEDPHTLQQAMEAEIRSTLGRRVMSRATGRVPSLTFLTAMAPVMAREPGIFLEAVTATCVLEEEGGRSVVSLAKDPARDAAAARGGVGSSTRGAAGSTEGGEGSEGAPKEGGAAGASTSTSGGATPGKEARKASRRPPESFVQVISHLVGIVVGYDPTKPSALLGAEGMDVDGAEGGPSSSSSSPAPPSGGAKDKKDAKDADLARGKKEPSPKALRVALAVKLLTDFCLMYGSAAGVILKCDAEDAASVARSGAGLIIRHVMRALLPDREASRSTAAASPATPEKPRALLSERAGQLLLALCVRSSEGRRRIVGEAARLLDEVDGEGNSRREPAEVKAYVELVNSLLSAASPSASGRAPSALASSGLAGEIARAMTEAKMIPVLAKSLHLLDLHHPGAPRLVNAVLKPLETLTRVSVAVRSGPGGGAWPRGRAPGRPSPAEVAGHASREAIAAAAAAAGAAAPPPAAGEGAAAAASAPEAPATAAAAAAAAGGSGGAPAGAAAPPAAAGTGGDAEMANGEGAGAAASPAEGAAVGAAAGGSGGASAGAGAPGGAGPADPNDRFTVNVELDDGQGGISRQSVTVRNSQEGLQSVEELVGAMMEDAYEEGVHGYHSEDDVSDMDEGEGHHPDGGWVDAEHLDDDDDEAAAREMGHHLDHSASEVDDDESDRSEGSDDDDDRGDGEEEDESSDDSHSEDDDIVQLGDPEEDEDGEVADHDEMEDGEDDDEEEDEMEEDEEDEGALPDPDPAWSDQRVIEVRWRDGLGAMPPGEPMMMLGGTGARGLLGDHDDPLGALHDRRRLGSSYRVLSSRDRDRLIAVTGQGGAHASAHAEQGPGGLVHPLLTRPVLAAASDPRRGALAADGTWHSTVRDALGDEGGSVRRYTSSQLLGADALLLNEEAAQFFFLGEDGDPVQGDHRGNPVMMEMGGMGEAGRALLDNLGLAHDTALWDGRAGIGAGIGGAMDQLGGGGGAAAILGGLGVRGLGAGRAGAGAGGEAGGEAGGQQLLGSLHQAFLDHLRAAQPPPPEPAPPPPAAAAAAAEPPADDDDDDEELPSAPAEDEPAAPAPAAAAAADEAAAAATGAAAAATAARVRSEGSLEASELADEVEAADMNAEEGAGAGGAAAAAAAAAAEGGSPGGDDARPEAERAASEVADEVAAATIETPEGTTPEATPEASPAPAPPEAEAAEGAVGPQEVEEEAPAATDAGGDVEMADQAEAAAAQPEGGGAPETAEGDAGAGPSEDEDPIMAAARAAGIDPAFLEALPPEMRDEVLAAHVPQAVAAAQASSGAAAAAGAAGGSGGAGAAGAGAAGLPPDVDPEFLAALPPDMQAEVLQQQAAARQAQTRAAQAAPANPLNAQDMDSASIIASLDAELREDVLLMADEAVLAQLPPALLAEAQLLRERAVQRYRAPPPPAAEEMGVGRAVQAGGAPPPRGGGGGGGQPFHMRARREGNRINVPGLGELIGATIGNGSFARDGGRGASGSRGGGGVAGGAAEMPGPEMVDEDALRSLVQLLRIAQPLGKGLLQRLMLNLCAHSKTRESILRMLLSLLRGSPGGEEGGGAAGDPGAPAPARLEDALGSSAAHPSQGDAMQLYGCHASVVYSRSAGAQGVPPLVSRRVLEVLTFLARHDPRVARRMLRLGVPPSDAPAPSPAAAAASAAAAKKGKAKVTSEAPAARPSSGGEESALVLLLGLLEQQLYRRSTVHLEQALQLLEVALRCTVAETNAVSAGSPKTPAGEAAASAAAAAAAGGATPPPAGAGAAGAAGAAGTTTPDGKGKEPADPLRTLGQGHIHGLPRLLGEEGLSEMAYSRCASVTRLLAGVQEHRAYLVQMLCDEARRLSTEAAGELQALADAATATDPAPTSAGRGTAVLRVLQVVTSLCLSKKVALEERRRRLREQGLAVSEGGDDVPSEGEETLDRLAAELQPLWDALSVAVERLEKELEVRERSSSGGGAGAAPAPGGAASLVVLPPGTSRVLPLVEAFFVLSDDGKPPAHEVSASQRERERGSGAPITHTRMGSTPVQLAPLVRSGSVEGIRSMDGPLPNMPAVSPKTEPFLRFGDRHRRLLNALVRQNPALLDGSLKLLLKNPRLVDFDNKRAHFRARIRARYDDRHAGSMRIRVRRSAVFEDSYHQMRMRTPDEMRGRLAVQFQGEEGIDAGGLTREWYLVLCRQVFNPDLPLFTPQHGSTYQPHPNSGIEPDHLLHFKFVGRVVGKALFDGQLLDAYFTRSFYKHMLGVPITYHDIEAIDPDYYKNLKWMLDNSIEGVLDLTFTAEAEFGGEIKTVELKPGGAALPVTESNKSEYVNLMAEHRMTTAIKPQTEAFLEGFHELVPRELISIFNDHELELLISGLPEIDVDDLVANTEYTGCTAASPVVQWFWAVVRDLSKEDKARFLQFCTGTSKVPIDGFRSLQGISGPQKFQIHRAYGTPDRLPSAHTCFNQLDLVEYESQEQLRERLLMAIKEGSEGFGFG